MRSNSNDLPNGNLNLNLIRGMENVFLFPPCVCTRTHFGVMAMIRTLVLLVNPSFLFKFLNTMQVSLIFSFRVCGGTPFLLKLFKTSSVSIFRRILCGSSLSASSLCEARFCGK